MATVASTGLNMLVEYANANPYGAAAAFVVVGASMLACATVGKCQKSAAVVQKSAAVVQKVVQQVDVSVDGTTCTLVGRPNMALSEFDQKLAALVTKDQITKLVLRFDTSKQNFPRLDVTILCAQFPKLALIDLTKPLIGREQSHVTWKNNVPEHVKLEQYIPSSILGNRIRIDA